MINISTHKRNDQSSRAQGESSIGDFSTIPCPNPQCIGGYTRRTDCPQLLKVCPSCDGLGFLGNVADNRKRYYLLRNIASELELQSRIGRGLITRANGALTGEANVATGSERETLAASPVDEHVCDISANIPSCLRIS